MIIIGHNTASLRPESEISSQLAKTLKEGTHTEKFSDCKLRFAKSGGSDGKPDNTELSKQGAEKVISPEYF